MEKELDSLEKKFNDSFSKFSINSNRVILLRKFLMKNKKRFINKNNFFYQLKINYNEFDTMDVFSKLIESIKLEADSQVDEKFLIQTKKE